MMSTHRAMQGGPVAYLQIPLFLNKRFIVHICGWWGCGRSKIWSIFVDFVNVWPVIRCPKRITYDINEWSKILNSGSIENDVKVLKTYEELKGFIKAPTVRQKEPCIQTMVIDAQTKSCIPAESWIKMEQRLVAFITLDQYVFSNLKEMSGISDADSYFD